MKVQEVYVRSVSHGLFRWAAGIVYLYTTTLVTILPIAGSWHRTNELLTYCEYIRIIVTIKDRLWRLFRVSIMRAHICAAAPRDRGS